MKRGTPDHPKVLDLQQRLGVGVAQACGTLELLWHWTARYAPAGDVGRWPDAAIAYGCGWEGDPGALVAALVASRWLDEDQAARLVVHDWQEHADDAVHVALYRSIRTFVNGAEPKPSRISKKEREKLDGAWACARRAHGVRTESAQPEPRQSPALAPPRQSPAAAVGAVAPTEPPPPASRAQADVSELEALAADVAQLRARATGRPTDAAAELLAASTTPSGRTFSRARDATPAWRAATRDRLLACRAELVEQLRASAGGAPAAPDVLPPGAAPPESNGSAIETWELVLAALRDQVSRGSWATWFRPTSGWSCEGGVLVVAVPTAQFAGWLAANYRAAVEEAVRQAGLTTTVRFVARSAAA